MCVQFFGFWCGVEPDKVERIEITETKDSLANMGQHRHREGRVCISWHVLAYGETRGRSSRKGDLILRMIPVYAPHRRNPEDWMDAEDGTLC